MDAHERKTDLELEILDLLRDGPKSSYRLAAALTHSGEVIGTDAVRKRLKTLASRGLVTGTAPIVSGYEAEPPPPLADPWSITEEGRALIQPEVGVANAPYDREVGGREEGGGGGREAGFWVLIVIAVLTAACAAYSLLVATGFLGGAYRAARNFDLCCRE